MIFERTGTGTIMVFGRTTRHKMKTGFPLLTTKKMYYKANIHETLWFLMGSSNIKYLVDNNVNIWVGDCYKRYCKICSANSNEYNKWMRLNVSEDPLVNGTLSMYTEKEFIEKIKTDKEFSDIWAELGNVYGKEWCNWYGINQVQEVMDLLKTDPDNRRMLVTAWNPLNVKTATLPPCHYAWQVFTEKLSLDERISYAIKNNGENLPDQHLDWTHEVMDEYNVPKRKISLMYQIRSLDVALGKPFDDAAYGLLLSMIAHCANMIPDELIMNSGNTHLYLNQIEGIKEQLTRKPFELPTLKLNKNVKNIFDFKYEDFEILNYKCHDKIYLPLSN